MVEVKLIGYLGNNMFQYSIGRIIADAKEYNLSVANIENISQYFPNICNIQNRQTITENVLNVGYESIEKTIQNFNLQDTLKHTGKIIMSGFFQKYFFYEQKKEFLKQIFHYPDNNFIKPGKKDLVVHVRLGDYVNMNYHLNINEYIKIINTIEYDNCIIITDDPNNILLTPFRNVKNSFLFNKNLIEDFTILKYANNLLLSQSTFSWWAAFLGNQEKVYVPLYKTKNGFPWKLNPDYDDIDLIPNNLKFIKIPV